MKQKATSSSSKENNSMLATATEDEIFVAEILVDLKNLVSLSESLSNFNWGRRRRRSSYNDAPPLPPPPRVPSPAVRRTEDEIQERKPHIKPDEEEEQKVAAARTTASPDTPLSFSPSESDDKHKHSSKKTSRKRSREDYIDMIEGLTQRGILLQGEVENVKKYYQKLKDLNTELKALKQKMLRKEEPQMETTGGMNLGTEITQHYRIDMVHHQQPLIADPTAQNIQYPFGPITTQLFSSNNGPGSVNQVGPFGFDLNMPAEGAFGMEPSQPLDLSLSLADKRARYAEARRKRRLMIKIKSMRSSTGINLPTNR